MVNYFLALIESDVSVCEIVSEMLFRVLAITEWGTLALLFLLHSFIAPIHFSHDARSLF